MEKLVYNQRVKSLLILLILAFSFPTLAANCQDLQHVYGTIDLTKKSWITEKEIEPVSWCLPLIKKDHNLLITLTKKDRSFKVGTFQSLFEFWDELKNKKLQGGVQKATSFMIRVPLPEWSKDASVSVTDIESGEVIARGVL